MAMVYLLTFFTYLLVWLFTCLLVTFLKKVRGKVPLALWHITPLHTTTKLHSCQPRPCKGAVLRRCAMLKVSQSRRRMGGGAQVIHAPNPLTPHLAVLGIKSSNSKLPMTALSWINIMTVWLHSDRFSCHSARPHKQSSTSIVLLLCSGLELLFWHFKAGIASLRWHQNVGFIGVSVFVCEQVFARVVPRRYIWTML